MNIIIFSESGAPLTLVGAKAFLVTEEIDGEECVQFVFKQDGETLTWHGINEPDELRKLAQSISGMEVKKIGKEDAITDTKEE